MNLEDYIKNLDSELQERARACGSVEELLALAKDAKVPVPDEALAAIAGGDGASDGNCMTVICPKCKSRDITAMTDLMGDPFFHCNACGYEWV